MARNVDLMAVEAVVVRALLVLFVLSRGNAAFLTVLVRNVVVTAVEEYAVDVSLAFPV